MYGQRRRDTQHRHTFSIMATKSRFFAGSSSESENESDNESKSSDDAPITQRQAAGRFATFDESDSGQFVSVLWILLLIN